MRSTGLTSILLVITMIVITSWAVQVNTPHSFGNKCFTCHVGKKDPTILTREPDFLCLSCHPEQKTMSHPTGIVPERNLPDIFPLYRGKLLCITCHIAHKTFDKNDTDHIQFDNNPYLLRFGQTGKRFCYQCHGSGPDGFTINKSNSHALGFAKAHSLSHDISLKNILDDGSRECLSCHDGSLSTDAEVNASGVRWEHSGGIGVSHPIGIEYNEISRRKHRAYHPASSIDRRIKLFDGKIGCQTCHTHYSEVPHLLVMDNKRSRLCLQCHNL